MALTEAQKQKIEEEEKYRASLKKDYSQPLMSKTNRNRILAALLAIFLGDIGIHKFYLGKAGWGIIYIIFSWTFIPMILGFIEGIMYLCMSDKSFENKYS